VTLTSTTRDPSLTGNWARTHSPAAAVLFVVFIGLMLNVQGGLPQSDRMGMVLGGLTLSADQMADLSSSRRRHFEELYRSQREVAKSILEGKTKSAGAGTHNRIFDAGIELSKAEKMSAVRSYLLQIPRGDEGASYNALSQMNPGKLDFDPKFYN